MPAPPVVSLWNQNSGGFPRVLARRWPGGANQDCLLFLSGASLKISPGSYILFLLGHMLDFFWIKRNFFHSHPLLTGASCWPDSGCFLFCLSVSFWQLLQTCCPSWPQILSFSILMIIARCKTFDLLLPCWAKTVWMLNAGQGQTLPLLGQKASGINFKTILQNFKIP